MKICHLLDQNWSQNQKCAESIEIRNVRYFNNNVYLLIDLRRGVLVIYETITSRDL